MKLFAHDCLSMIMTDEVHTVSEQGFGFRPSMLALGDVRRTLPGECRPLCSCHPTPTLAHTHQVSRHCTLQRLSRTWCSQISSASSNCHPQYS